MAAVTGLILLALLHYHQLFLLPRYVWESKLHTQSQRSAGAAHLRLDS